MWRGLLLQQATSLVNSSEPTRVMIYDYQRLTYSNVVSPQPVLLGTIMVTGSQGNNAVVTLYDGESTDDPQIVQLRCPSDNTKVVHFQSHLATKRGLYVELGTNVQEVLVQYLTTKEKGWG